MANTPVGHDSMLVVYREADPGNTVYKVTINDADQARAKLDNFDRALLADCNKPDATVADKLLALETLVRRIEEAKG